MQVSVPARVLVQDWILVELKPRSMPDLKTRDGEHRRVPGAQQTKRILERPVRVIQQV